MRHKKCRMTEDRPNRSLSCPLLQLLEEGETDRQRGRGGNFCTSFSASLSPFLSSVPLSSQNRRPRTSKLFCSSTLAPPLHLLQQLRSKSLLLCATLPSLPPPFPLFFFHLGPFLPTEAAAAAAAATTTAPSSSSFKVAASASATGAAGQKNRPGAAAPRRRTDLVVRCHHP